jgi:2-polyprenyl-6-methoxyphenol hydroxylase-like FAD-dependent oxidoreductase
MRTSNVLIIGGGLGGLCLAHGLAALGFSPTIFERDAGPDVRGQGYRLTIDETGSEALRACLPPQHYEFIRTTASRIGKTGAFIFLDEHAHEFHRFTFDMTALERRGLIMGRARPLAPGRRHHGLGTAGFPVLLHVDVLSRITRWRGQTIGH